MKVIELIEAIKNEQPDALGKVADKRAARIVRAALAEIARQIDASEEGTVKIAGLGNFRVRNVKRGKEGEEKTVRRVAFRAAKGGKVDEGAGEEA